jgi:mono/diheme cytochrome c family protein/glucose/arabinose dehydrogenase
MAGLAVTVLASVAVAGLLIGHYVVNGRTRTVIETKATTTGARAQKKVIAGKLVSIGGGLKGPIGTRALVYATHLVNISDLTLDSRGGVWAAVSGDPGEKAATPDGVYRLEPGKLPEPILTGSQVDLPVGIAWAGNTLIVSNYGYIEAWSGFNGSTFAQHKILFAKLAAGTSGWSDNGAVAPDGKIYLNVGAACDACNATGKLEADIISFEPNGSDLKIVATKVRGNAFTEFMPGTDTLFAAMNQQNDLTPAPDDQLGIIKQGQNWGFPTCYGQGGKFCHGVATALAFLPQHNGTSAMALTDGQLGRSYGTSAFVSSFSYGAVDRVALKKTGSSYVSTGLYQFVTGLKLADGLLLDPRQHALLMGDRVTGTVYEVRVSPTVNPASSAQIAYKVPPTVAVPNSSIAANESNATNHSPLKNDSTPAGTANAQLDAGLEIFKSDCASCHTLAEAGAAGNVGPDLDLVKPTYGTVVQQVTNGGGVMPAFGTSGQLTQHQIAAVAKYVSSVAGTKKK